MRREQLLQVPVPGLEDRIAKIEAEALPANIGALLESAAADVPDRTAWITKKSFPQAYPRKGVGPARKNGNLLVTRG